MRDFKWGAYPSQAANFAANAPGGLSMIVDKSGTNDAGTSNYNPQNLQIANNVMYTGRCFVKVVLASIRAAIGHSPVIVRAVFHTTLGGGATPTVPVTSGLFRLRTIPDWADVNSRYYDVSAVLPWGGDAGIYAPVPGVDHIATPFATVTSPTGVACAPPTSVVPLEFVITSEMAYVLAANADLMFLWSYSPIGTRGVTSQMLYPVWKDPAQAAFWPYLSIRYLNPIEFFACKASGLIDLTKLLDNSTGLDADSLYLGAVEAGQTGTPVAARVKNLGTRTLPHLEIWDDSPEWSTPAADPANTGSGVLDHVVLADASVSQKYTIKFTSATAYQVKAEAYKDNTAALNTTYGTSGWTGGTGADFVAPSGGLTIPAAAWSGTPAANDLITVYVTGNTTLATWPADSNSQVQIAKDDGTGLAADAATWRPIKGQRTLLTSPVTIDATSKTLTVRYIATALWPTTGKVFIADDTNIDEGTITAQTATSLTVTFPAATSHAYAAGAKVCSTLPVRNLAIATRAVTTGAAGVSQANPAYIPMTNASTLGFSAGQVCSIQSVDDPSLIEEFTVNSADTARILAAAYLTHDYTTGAVVIVGGTGESQFWVRIVATLTTVEERKQLRFGVRT